MANHPSTPQSEQATFSPFRLLSNLITIINIGGNMSEQGADKAGDNISTGIKFFFCCGGLALLVVALAFGYHLIQ